MTPNFYSLSKSLRHHENLTASEDSGADVTPTGATESTYDDGGTTYTVQTWTSSGSFVVGEDATMEILVIAGGGHAPAIGLGDGCGGSGAGGFKYYYQKTLVAATYTVTVGGQDNNSSITDGASLTLESEGGGRGIANKFGHTQANRDGGSGGSGYTASGGYGPGGDLWGTGQGQANQGNDGGNGFWGTAHPSWQNSPRHGGGGGAKTVGANATSTSSGNGGTGYTEGTDSVYDWTAADGSTQTFKINGTGNGYAGGGGGSMRNSTGTWTQGLGTQGGGDGGGSNQYDQRVDGTSGTDGTGGGGGGGNSWHANSGGSGVVIIRYV